MNALSMLSGLSGPSAPLPHAASAPTQSPAADVKQKLQRKAVEFEAVYLTQMLKPMFDNLDAAEPFGGGTGEDVWRSMQVDEYGKAIAARGGVGLADRVARELLALQEAHSGEPR